MKNKLKYISKSILFICLLLIVGCDDYLSELPDNRTLIDSPEKIAPLITGAYPQANYMLIAELMSDNAGDKENTNKTKKLDLQMYSWEDSNLEGSDTPTYYWNSCYHAISQANQALESIGEMKGKFDLKAQKGEALLCRAYAHFMLVNFWGKSYNPKTATTDLGVPYVFTPEKVLLKSYKRNTVQEDYDFIEKDLLEGLTLVQDNYEQPKFHFTKAAGYAFATRFYLYKGEWDKVITYASKVLINPADEIRDMSKFGKFTYSESKRNYASPLTSTNLLIGLVHSSWIRGGFVSSRFSLNVDITKKLFHLGNGNPFGKSWLYKLYGGSDYIKNFAKFEGSQVVLFSEDEVLLNRAEAYVMKKDYTNALSDLTVFLSKKTKKYDTTDILTAQMIMDKFPVRDGEFTPFYPIESGKQASFIKAITGLKRREFMQEGFRWFDIKRFHIVVTHEFSQKDGLKKPAIVLTKDDPRRQLQIPLIAQKTIVPNPRLDKK